MTCTVYILSIAPLMYSAFGFIIRYLYVKASLQPAKVQAVYTRRQFTVKAVCLGEFLNLYCILVYTIRQFGQSGKQRVDLLLYQACLGEI